ncbi:MAG: hypothetical protein LBS43_00145 [Prevotellaceae bacterium]|jgi:hypothetical protein|nr:hypothetical protein [Prevotellaceae bacterium]
MGFIREPEGVDFVIDSGTLSDKDREEISLYIRNYKLEMSKKKKSGTKKVKLVEAKS